MSRKPSGLRAWLWQRLTAVYLALFLVTTAAALWLHPVTGFADWQARLAGPWTGAAAGLFGLALALHAWVGMRDVILDYVHRLWLRVLLLAAVAAVLAGSLFWMLAALLPAGLTGGS